MLLAELFDVLERQARRRPDAVALQETSGRRLTYAELVAEIESAAWQSAIPRNDERVLFAVRPSLEAFVLVLAEWRAGHLLVPLEARLSDEVFAARMREIDPDRLLVDRVDLVGELASAALAAGSVWGEGADLRVLPTRSILPADTWSGWAFRPPPPVQVSLVGSPWPWWRGRKPPFVLGRRSDLLAPTPPRERSVPLLAVFTAGTTGAPRAVVHTNASLGASLGLVADHPALGSDAVVYGDQLHLVLPALLAGAKVVVPRGRRSADATLAELDRWQTTHLLGTTGSLQSLLDVVERGAGLLPASLRSVTLGAAPVPAAFLARLRRALPPGATAGCVYALTEMLPVAWVSLEEKLAYSGPGDLVGRPFPGIEASLAGDGELLLRGPNRCERYHGQPRLEALASGDLATIDADGRISLLGRKKDMIIRDGINIYPSLVEPTVERVPGVRACALVGLVDPVSANERLVLAVEPERKIDPSELLRRIRKALNGLDAPYRPEQVLLLRLPRAGRSDKVDRAAVRLLARRRLPC